MSFKQLACTPCQIAGKCNGLYQLYGEIVTCIANSMHPGICWENESALRAIKLVETYIMVNIV